MTTNPFKDPYMQGQYTAARRAYDVRHPSLFVKGKRRERGSYGSSFAIAFWNGYDFVTKGINGFASRQARQMIGYAWYRAGRDIAKEEGKLDHNQPETKVNRATMYTKLYTYDRSPHDGLALVATEGLAAPHYVPLADAPLEERTAPRTYLKQMHYVANAIPNGLVITGRHINLVPLHWANLKDWNAVRGVG
jgi:hypothetical protein